MYSGKDDIYQGPIKMSRLVITQQSGSWFKRENNLAPLIHHNKNKLQRDKKMNNKKEMIFLI